MFCKNLLGGIPMLFKQGGKKNEVDFICHLIRLREKYFSLIVYIYFSGEWAVVS